jgi:UDP-N-acetylglucosamine--N-acetylmuramyl-(pentapeptide) pyrophosphoryl-undecaprenol N-acetylglucosamine transferase
VAELIGFQKPALLIPFPFAADDHQKKNGQFLAETIGGARLLLQSEATAEKIADEIELLWKEKETFQAALKLARLQNKGKIDLSTLVSVIGKKR